MDKYKNPPTLLTETFLEREIKESNKKNGILLLDLETNRTCNLRCNYCFIGNMSNINMSFEKVKKIINQAKKEGVKTINLIGGGDPTLYNYKNYNLLDIINYIRKNKINIEMFTNGLVFGDNRMSKGIFNMDSKELIKTLYKKKVTIVFSIKSANKNTYNKIVGVTGKYNIMKKALKNLISSQYTKNINKMPQLALETVMTKQNYKEIPNLFRFVRKNKIIPFFEIVRISGKAKENKNKVALSKKQVKNLFEKVLKIDQKEFGYTWLPIPPHFCFICDLNRFTAYITVNGIVYNCESFALKFGNIKNKKLKQILKNPKVKKIRNLAKNIKGNCQTCKFLKQGDCYGGCIGQAYAETNNAFSGDPVCWQND